MADMDPESVDAVLTTTRAVRRRLDLDRPVEREVVERCLEIAIQAPSGSNRQGWHFLLVDEPAPKEGLAALYRRAFAAYRKVAACSPDSGRNDSCRTRRVFASAEYLAENLHRAPFLLVTAVEGRPEGTSAHRQSSFWGAILPATWNFMLAARSRGLGTAWTSMHLQYEREAAEILGIPYDEVTQACLTPVAYTIGTDFRPAPRKPLQSVVHRNRW